MDLNSLNRVKHVSQPSSTRTSTSHGYISSSAPSSPRESKKIVVKPLHNHKNSHRIHSRDPSPSPELVSNSSNEELDHETFHLKSISHEETTVERHSLFPRPKLTKINSLSEQSTSSPTQRRKSTNELPPLPVQKKVIAVHLPKVSYLSRSL